MCCRTSIECHCVILQVNYSDVDGGRGNVQNDTDWNQDASDFDSDFSHSGGRTCQIYISITSIAKALLNSAIGVVSFQRVLYRHSFM